MRLIHKAKYPDYKYQPRRRKTARGTPTRAQEWTQEKTQEKAQNRTQNRALQERSKQNNNLNKYVVIIFF